jgi:hypothetical protein
MDRIGGGWTEARRMLRWQRIAPPFAAGACPVYVSDDILYDTGFVNDTWFMPKFNSSITQAGPAAVSRGIPLPVVTAAEGDIPFTAAGRNTNGAVGIVTLGREDSLKRHYVNRMTNVTVNVGDPNSTIGVFGVYGSLILMFDSDITNKTIWAQDLLANTAEDVTKQVSLEGNTLIIPGVLIDKIGTSCNPMGNNCEPGLVVQINRLT